MHATVTTSGGSAILRLEGRFDFNAHREFRDCVDKAVADASAREIQVDLGGVDSLDSSALGMLLMTRDKVNNAGKTMSLANVRGTVKQIIDIANFGKLFTIT